MGVINLGEKTSNSMHQSPVQIFEEAKNRCGVSGAFESGKKALVIALDDSNGGYEVSFLNAGMTCSEAVALCEYIKTLMLDYMLGREDQQ